MEPDSNKNNLRQMSFYLKKAFKFYEMKNESITPIIFVFILFVSFAGFFLPGGKENITVLDIVYNVLGIILVYLASSVYLHSYILELKGQAFTFSQSLRHIAKRSLFITGASLIYIAAVLTGFMLLLVPGVIVYVTFLFYNCRIVDKGSGIAGALNGSRIMTKGLRLEIFGLIAMVNILLLPVSMFIIAFSGNEVIFIFVLTFAGTIVNIMQQRLTALMYMDIEYGADYKDKPVSFK